MFTYDGTNQENGVTVNIWTVQLYQNGAAKYVTVDSELPAGGKYYDNTTSGVLWVALAEKAYAEFNGLGWATTGHLRTDSYAALNDGWPTWALPAITGASASNNAINPSNIGTAWQQGELVVLCSKATTPNPNIVPSHCYAMVGYNASVNQAFQIYNPWGTTADGNASGTWKGHTVYGLFWAGASLISNNYSWQSFGVGAAATTNDSTHAQTGLTATVSTTTTAAPAASLTSAADNAFADLRGTMTEHVATDSVDAAFATLQTVSAM